MCAFHFVNLVEAWGQWENTHEVREQECTIFAEIPVVENQEKLASAFSKSLEGVWMARWEIP